MEIRFKEEDLIQAKKHLYELGLYDAYESLERTVRAEMSKKWYRDISGFIMPKDSVNKCYCEVWLDRDFEYNEHGEPIVAVYSILGYQAYKVETRGLYDAYTHLLVNTFINYINLDLERIKEL